jgi:mRNA-degrading endonuclease RelE of RelBE toxin-antitoxin system
MKETKKPKKSKTQEIQEVIEISKLVVVPTTGYERMFRKLDEASRLKVMAQTEHMNTVTSLSELKNIRPIIGSENSYRVKFGDLRIVFEKIGKELILRTVANRKDVYKKK